jgi:hypothetical protein
MAEGTNPEDFSTPAERARWVRDNPDAPITCACGGNGCRTCDGQGTLPAWVVDPQITGHPHERRR